MVTDFDLQCADIFTRITDRQGIKKGANPRKWTAPECKGYSLHQFRKSNTCPHFGQWISLCPRAMISSRVAKSFHISTPKASAILSRVGEDGLSPICCNNPLLVIPNFSAKAACVYPFSLISSLIRCFIFLILIDNFRFFCRKITLFFSFCTRYSIHFSLKIQKVCRKT